MGRFASSGVLTGCAVLWLAASGCASTSARSESAEALRLAQEANQRATAAQADAAAARQAADEAVMEARRASEKSDRIFQRSIQK